MLCDFAGLLQAQIPRLRRYASVLTYNKSDADDLVQECLARALAAQHRWQPDTNLYAWLSTILHNVYVDGIRRAKREALRIAIDRVAGTIATPAEAERRLEMRDLARALEELPEGRRAAVFLVQFEGLSYETAAAILGIPVGTVRSRLSRAREQLRILMGAHAGEPVVARMQ